MGLLGVTGLGLVVGACGATPSPRDMQGCGSDSDCKDNRVCMMAICVEPSTGSGGSTSAGGGTGTAGTTGNAGTTGTAGTTGNAIDKFVGTWRYTGGARVLDQCDDGSAPSTTPITSGSATFNRGPDGMTVTIGSSSCVIRYDVSGDTVTARSGQACSGIVSGTDLQLTIQVMSSVYTTADGANMQSNEVLQLTIGNSTGSLSCRRTENGTLVKP